MRSMKRNIRKFTPGYEFSGWVGFLKQRGLVEAVGHDFRITPKGDDFLQWLRATKFPLNRAW